MLSTHFMVIMTFMNLMTVTTAMRVIRERLDKHVTKYIPERPVIPVRGVLNVNRGRYGIHEENVTHVVLGTILTAAMSVLSDFIGTRYHRGDANNCREYKRRGREVDNCRPLGSVAP
jgi:hypothetical protein